MLNRNNRNPQRNWQISFVLMIGSNSSLEKAEFNSRKVRLERWWLLRDEAVIFSVIIIDSSLETKGWDIVKGEFSMFPEISEQSSSH